MWGRRKKFVDKRKEEVGSEVSHGFLLLSFESRLVIIILNEREVAIVAQSLQVL